MLHPTELISDLEADNMDRAGRYALSYGVVLTAANVGLLMLLFMAGWPLEGVAGAATIAHVLFDLMAVCALLLAAYALYCYRYSQGRTRLRASVKMLAMAGVFALCGFEHDNATALVLGAMQWVGATQSCCVAMPLL